MHGVQGVGSSNRLAPTLQIKGLQISGCDLFLFQPMFRLHLVVSTVFAIGGAIFWPVGAIVMGLMVWILSSGGLPDRTVWTIIGSVGGVVLAIVALFVFRSVRKLWLVAPNGMQGTERIASIAVHLLLAVAHCLFAVLIFDTRNPKLSNAGSHLLIVLVLGLYCGGSAALFSLSDRIKPRRLDW